MDEFVAAENHFGCAAIQRGPRTLFLASRTEEAPWHRRTDLNSVCCPAARAIRRTEPSIAATIAAKRWRPAATRTALAATRRASLSITTKQSAAIGAADAKWAHAV